MTTWQEANKKTNERITALGQRVSTLEKPRAWHPVPDPTKWKLRKADDLSAKTPEEVTALWGAIEAASPSRLTYHETGGPDGGPYRNLQAKPGDEATGNGCRAELGKNDSRLNTFAKFVQGDRALITWFMRLPVGYLLELANWKTVMQIKELEPDWEDGQGPALEMEVRSGMWIPVNSWKEIPGASVTAHENVWTYFAAEVVFDQTNGSYQLSVTEQGQPTIQTPTVSGLATLKTQLEPPSSISATDSRRTTIKAGTPIPSHLRIGDYHSPSLPLMPGVDVGAVGVYVSA